MAFGNDVTTGTLISSGQYGYVVAFDLSDRYIDDLISAQMINGTSWSEETAKTEMETLLDYPQDSDAPDFASAQIGTLVYLFCKQSVYPYVVTTRVAFFYYRNPTILSATTDKPFVPSESRNLFVLMCMEESMRLNEMTPSREISQKIEREIAQLELNQ